MDQRPAGYVSIVRGFPEKMTARDGELAGRYMVIDVVLHVSMVIARKINMNEIVRIGALPRYGVFHYSTAGRFQYIVRSSSWCEGKKGLKRLA